MWSVRMMLIMLFAFSSCVSGYRKKEDKTMCPQVKGARNFNLESLLGSWYVVQYYATSEEDVMYKCMRAVFSMGPGGGPEVDLNITYSFVDDPDNEMLMGNITYVIPDASKPAHWVHSEDTLGSGQVPEVDLNITHSFLDDSDNDMLIGNVILLHYLSMPVQCVISEDMQTRMHLTVKIVLEMYNTYILDCDNNEWALLLNCAEKPKSPRYLTSLMISKTPKLAPNVVSFLRDKLPKYDITLDFMFEMKQADCEDPGKNLHYASASLPAKTKKAKHPLKRRTRSKNSMKRH